jgi:hypothetical protein
VSMLPNDIRWLSSRNELRILSKYLLGHEPILFLVLNLVVSKSLCVIDGLRLSIIRLESNKCTHWPSEIFIVCGVFHQFI